MPVIPIFWGDSVVGSDTDTWTIPARFKVPIDAHFRVRIEMIQDAAAGGLVFTGPLLETQEKELDLLAGVMQACDFVFDMASRAHGYDYGFRITVLDANASPVAIYSPKFTNAGRQ